MANILGTNTYITTEDARIYADENGLELPADDTQLELLLRQASKLIDRRWGNRFLGFKAVPSQPMAWPRIVTNTFRAQGEEWLFTMDSDGNPRSFSGLQPEVAEATVEVAAMLNDDKLIIEERTLYDQPAPAIASEKSELDVLKEEVQYASPHGHKVDHFWKIKLILRPLLSVATGPKLARGA